MGDQDLSFKVMRLCRPSFHQAQAAYTEPTDVLGCLTGVGSDATPSAADTGENVEGIGLAGMLTLPPNFGKTYMGEKFSSYISAFNHSRGDVTSVGLKAELQTKTTRKTLLDTTSTPLPGFSAAENRDFVVEAPLRELGTHILVCSAQYVNAFGEKKAFRQFFKFQVLEAFEVKNRVRALFHGASGRTIFLEVALRSKMPTPVFIETISFRESPMFTNVEQNLDADEPSPMAPKASGGNFLAPNDVRQFMYRLEPNKTLEPAEGFELGQFEMTWRTAVGERGELQQPIPFGSHTHGDDETAHSGGGSGVGRIASSSDSSMDTLSCDVSLMLEHLPAVITAEKVFEVGLVLTNLVSAPKEFILLPCTGLTLDDINSARVDSAPVDEPAQNPIASGSKRGQPYTQNSNGLTDLQAAEKAIWEALDHQDLSAKTIDSRGPVWIGMSPLNLGRVDGSSQKRFTITFFAPCNGEYALPALALVNTTSGQRHDFHKYGNVLVY